MKMNKRMLALLLVLVAVLCSACGSSDNPDNATQDSKTETAEPEATETETTPKEKNLDEIKADLNANSAEFIDYFGEVWQVTDLELIKRNTKGDSDTVYCTVTLTCDGAMIVQDFKFSYNHYTTGGWILDEFEPTGEANMTDTDETAALGANSDGGEMPEANPSPYLDSLSNGFLIENQTFYYYDDEIEIKVELYPDDATSGTARFTIQEGGSDSVIGFDGQYVLAPSGWFEVNVAGMEEKIPFSVDLISSPSTLLLDFGADGTYELADFEWVQQNAG